MTLEDFVLLGAPLHLIAFVVHVRVDKRKSIISCCLISVILRLSMAFCVLASHYPCLYLSLASY